MSNNLRQRKKRGGSFQVDGNRASTYLPTPQEDPSSSNSNPNTGFKKIALGLVLGLVFGLLIGLIVGYQIFGRSQLHTTTLHSPDETSETEFASSSTENVLVATDNEKMRTKEPTTAPRKFFKPATECQVVEMPVHLTPILPKGFSDPQPAMTVIGKCPQHIKKGNLLCLPTSSGNESESGWIEARAENGSFVEIQINLEKHTECDWSCSLQPKDCPPYHELDSSNECRCKCKPHACIPEKEFDEANCDCRCKKVTHCGTNYAFDHSTCQCEREEGK